MNSIFHKTQHETNVHEFLTYELVNIEWLKIYNQVFTAIHFQINLTF